MGSDGGYSLTEIFAIKFVLADIVIIAALLFAGPIYAVAITALLVVSVFLVWYLTERVGSPDGADADEPAREPVDPVTELQNRYAAGELSESEFEAKLERLLDANERAERAGVETRELSLERERS
ncbi:SHOCT domain-containing protein [Natronococcus sp.]|uniref:SHOCT domain-containing protein n=1 Tax=Natronococcus sp. TaxID=35747 RepID=UPI003A4DC9B5